MLGSVTEGMLAVAPPSHAVTIDSANWNRFMRKTPLYHCDAQKQTPKQSNSPADDAAGAIEDREQPRCRSHETWFDGKAALEEAEA